MTATPRQELAVARRRHAGAEKRWHAARRIMEIESRRISLLEARLSTAPSHVLTGDPKSQWHQPAYAFCRNCGAPAGSRVAEQACPGDTHTCSALVAANETPTAIRIHAGHWLCRQGGRYDTEYSEWTCAAGHITKTACPADRHVSGSLCPCYGLISVSSAWAGTP